MIRDEPTTPNIEGQLNRLSPNNKNNMKSEKIQSILRSRRNSNNKKNKNRGSILIAHDNRRSPE